MENLPFCSFDLLVVFVVVDDVVSFVESLEAGELGGGCCCGGCALGGGAPPGLRAIGFIFT